MGTKKADVQVLNETSTGLNNKLLVDGVKMTNNQAYKKAKSTTEGIPGYVAVNNNGTKYIRSKPDGNKNNNLN